jgi:hypothetical protein
MIIDNLNIQRISIFIQNPYHRYILTIILELIHPSKNRSPNWLGPQLVGAAIGWDYPHL